MLNNVFKGPSTPFGLITHTSVTERDQFNASILPVLYAEYTLS